MHLVLVKKLPKVTLMNSKLPLLLALHALLVGSWPAAAEPQAPASADRAAVVAAATEALARAGVPTAPGRQPLLVAAAADLKPVLEELLPAFEAAGGGPVRVGYGSSGTFFAQLTAGAPFDLFLSADAGYPARLVAAGLAIAGTEFHYAVGRLALFARHGSPVDPARGLAALAAPGPGKVAIANPAHAPYGRAAEAALAAAGLAAAVSPRLVLGENAAQAAQFAATSACDAGLIPLTLARAPALVAAGRHALVPRELHPPILQVGVVLAGAADPARARALGAFLQSPAARQVLARAGLEPP
jgi:molybdate transport system substrate-binding protein